MANAFQSNAFQAGAFQFSAGIPVTPRGFDETLALFAQERRREREEREIEQLFALETEMIYKALQPFVSVPPWRRKLR